MTRYRNAALVLVLCSACSGTSIQKVGSQYVTSKVIGPAGGTLTVSEADAPGMNMAGTSIIIPAGALSTSTQIGIGLSSQPVVATGAHGPVIDFEPSGTVFAVPATVSIPVTLNGLDPSRIGVMAVEPNGTSHDIAAVTVANALATFQVPGFTHYGCHDEGGEADSGVTCTPSCGGDAACGSSDGCGGACDANCTSDGGGCTPTCGGDAACGSSDGCGGACDANCTDGGCTPTCNSGAACGSSDGCGGVCNANCGDAGCEEVCGPVDGGEACVWVCDGDGGACTPSCAPNAACGSSDGCGGVCNANCGDAGCEEVCGPVDGGDECVWVCDGDGGACTPSCAPNAACGSSDGCGGTCNGDCLPDGGTLTCDGDAGQSFCGGYGATPYCAYLNIDPNNCGSCGTSCSSPNLDCVNAQCECPGGLTLCGDPDAGQPLFCTDTTQEPENCGACGNVCSETYAANSGCRLGICTCSPGQTYLCGTAGTAGAVCALDGAACDGG